MEKKSQISIFIIIAIIILGAFIIYFIFNDKSNINNINPEVQPIFVFVEQCIRETGENGIVLIGEKGGYVSSPDLSTSNGNPYYLYEDKNLMRTKEQVEKELSNYIKDNLNLCIDDFKRFNSFEINAGDISVNTKIEDDYTIFYVKYPVIVKKGKKSFEFRNFESKIKVRLGIIHNTIKDYMKEQMIYPKEVCISCIHSLALKNDLYVELKDIDKKTVLFTLIDHKTKFKEKEYSFVFANNYNIKENENI